MGSNPSDEAAVKAAEHARDTAYTTAEAQGRAVVENANQFAQAAEQRLATGMTLLAKSGNLRSEAGDAMSPSMPLAPMEDPTYASMRSSLTTSAEETAKQIADLTEKLKTASTTPTGGSDGGRGEDPGSRTLTSYDSYGNAYSYPSEGGEGAGSGGGGGPSEADMIRSQIKRLQETGSETADQLKALGDISSKIREVRAPEALTHTSGSDLLAMTDAWRAIENQQRRLVTGAEADIANIVKSGEFSGEQAKLLEQAAVYNNWTSILSTGISLAALALML
jgi:hypothetical protein